MTARCADVTGWWDRSRAALEKTGWRRSARQLREAVCEGF